MVTAAVQTDWSGADDIWVDKSVIIKHQSTQCCFIGSKRTKKLMKPEKEKPEKEKPEKESFDSSDGETTDRMSNIAYEFNMRERIARGNKK